MDKKCAQNRDTEKFPQETEYISNWGNEVEAMILIKKILQSKTCIL